jgi:hypothetical protein
MPVQKLSVALDEQVAAAARQSAERRGISLSAWLTEAARSALTIEDGLVGVAEWEAECGPPSAEEVDAANEALDAMGIGRRRESRRAA